MLRTAVLWAIMLQAVVIPYWSFWTISVPSSRSKNPRRKCVTLVGSLHTERSEQWKFLSSMVSANRVDAGGWRGENSLSAVLRQDGPESEATINSRSGRQKKAYIWKQGRRKVKYTNNNNNNNNNNIYLVQLGCYLVAVVIRYPVAKGGEKFCSSLLLCGKNTKCRASWQTKTYTGCPSS